MNTYLVSIVIPIYNVETFLKQCIESVINQTYKELQIILVNDGSTDGSQEICSKYLSDDRIMLINKENGGLSDARNVGTQHAKGNYIYYLDSDDYLEKDTIEQLVSAQKQVNTDIVLSNFYYKYSDYEDEANTLFDQFTVLNNYEAMAELVKGNIETFAWGKLIKIDIAKQFLFPKDRLFEDHYWTHYIFSKAKKVAILPSALVHYRQRNDSISYTYDLKRLDMIDGWIERKKFLENKYPDLVDIHMKKCSKQYVGMAWLVLTNMKKNKLLGLKKLKEYNKSLCFQNYSDHMTKCLITTLDGNIFCYIFLAVIVKIMNRINVKKRYL